MFVFSILGCPRVFHLRGTVTYLQNFNLLVRRTMRMNILQNNYSLRYSVWVGFIPPHDRFRIICSNTNQCVIVMFTRDIHSTPSNAGGCRWTAAARIPRKLYLAPLMIWQPYEGELEIRDDDIIMYVLYSYNISRGIGFKFSYNVFK